MVAVMVLVAMTPRLEKWLQQIPGKTEVSIQKNALLGTTKILRKSLSISQTSGRGS